MEPNPQKLGVLLDTVEVFSLMDVLDALVDTDGRKEKREAELKRKSEEAGLEIVRASGTMPAHELHYAKIAQEAYGLLRLDSEADGYNEILEAIRKSPLERAEQFEFTKYLYPVEIDLTRFLLRAYIEVSDTGNALAVAEAEGMLTQLDEKLAESESIQARKSS